MGVMIMNVSRVISRWVRVNDERGHGGGDGGCGGGVGA